MAEAIQKIIWEALIFRCFFSYAPTCPHIFFSGGMTMRKYMLLCSVLMAAMIILPLTTMEKPRKTIIVNEKISDKTESGVISVMKSESGKVEKTDIKEYTVGSLAAEMSMESHDEALKAQAVACYTYALYCKGKGNKDELNGADISDDSKAYQGYLNKDARKKKWGDRYDEYEKKAEKLVDEVLGQKMTYDGKPILAAYHDICSGKTESAKTVWGEDIAYLQSVTSDGDRLSPDYETTIGFDEEKFRSAIQMIDGIKLPEDSRKWVGKVDKTDTGFVNSVEIGGTKVDGGDIKKALGLSSRNFTITCEDGKFTLKAIGNGHMVGMSQYGADYMARQGSDWQEILKHYYTGVKIE